MQPRWRRRGHRQLTRRSNPSTARSTQWNSHPLGGPAIAPDCLTGGPRPIADFALSTLSCQALGAAEHLNASICVLLGDDGPSLRTASQAVGITYRTISCGRAPRAGATCSPRSQLEAWPTQIGRFDQASHAEFSGRACPGSDCFPWESSTPASD